MDIFRVSFIGHRVVDEYRQVEEELDEVIELLHRKYGFIDFNVGRNGEFDDLATQAVRRFRREWEERCELTLVEPYPVANLDIIEKSYDSVIIPTDRKCHYKAAIGERNKWLAENCDMMVVYIKRDYGGAYKCYKYAQELGVPIMNIADIGLFAVFAAVWAEKRLNTANLLLTTCAKKKVTILGVRKTVLRTANVV